MWPRARCFGLTGLEEGTAYKVRVRARYFDGGDNLTESGPWSDPPVELTVSAKPGGVPVLGGPVVAPVEGDLYAVRVVVIENVDGRAVQAGQRGVGVGQVVQASKRLPRGGLFTPDDPITVRNTCALKAG